jgi:cytochrome P450
VAAALKAALLAKIWRTGRRAALEPLLAPAVDEFLRFESSNQLSNRRAMVDASEGGGTCPKARC